MLEVNGTLVARREGGAFVTSRQSNPTYKPRNDAETVRRTVCSALGLVASRWGRGFSGVSVASQTYLATTGVLLIVYGVADRLRPAVVLVAAAVAVGVITMRVFRVRPQRSVAWLLLAAATGLLGVGHAILLAGLGAHAGVTSSPGAADAFLLAAYLPLTVGLLWLGRPVLPSRQWPVILDTVAFSLAGSLVLWIAVVRPMVVDAQLTTGGQVVAIAGWVGFVTVFAVSVRVVVTWPATVMRGLLGTGAIAFLLSDLAAGAGYLRLDRQPSGLATVGFVAVSGLYAAAAFTPSMVELEVVRPAREPASSGRLALLAVALLVAPTALFREAASDAVTSGVAIAAVSFAVGGAVMTRLWLFARAYQRRVDCERAVQVASRGLVLATSSIEVVEVVARALAGMVPGAPSTVRLANGYGRPVDLRQAQAGSAFADHVGAMDIVERQDGTGVLAAYLDNVACNVPVSQHAGPFSSAGQVLLCTAPIKQLVEIGSVLLLLAEQARAALDRITMVARLQTDERERYFRTLVLASTDVTLISRDDRVDYATPSADPMFGENIQGRSFGKLVIRNPSDDEGSGSRLQRAWSNVEDGVDGTIVRPDGQTVIVLVHRRDLTADPTVDGVVSTLRDVTTERNLQRDLLYRASHDSLTGLANAQSFTDELRVEPAAGKSGVGRAVLFIDLDDFKAVNDSHGHEVGDALLTVVAQRVEGCLRTDDFAARLGGDEFAILLRNLPSVDQARELAERIARALASPATVAGVRLDCRASIGVAYADRPERVATIVADADSALYAAKAHGKGRWWEYRDGDDAADRRSIIPRGSLDGPSGVDGPPVR